MQQHDSDFSAFAALDALGQPYQRRRSTRGVAYAGFVRPGARGGVSDYTLIVEHGVARLTLHTLVVAPDGRRLVALGALLPLGAAYVDPDSGLPELSIGLHVGAGHPGPEAVAELLRHAEAARAWLESGGTPPAWPACSRPGHCDAVDFDAALGRHGHRLRPLESGGLGFDVPLGPQLGACIEVDAPTADSTPSPDGLAACWLRARGRLVPDRPLKLEAQHIALLQRLQRWTTAGRFMLDREGCLVAEVATPRWAQDAAPALVWTASQVAAMLQVAAQHFART